MSRQTINPLTRVEGLGTVHLHLDGEQLQRVELRLSEPPRLFESLLCGRRIDEVPALVSRICAICSTPHALAACLALERVLDLTPPPAATLVRKLALLGNLIQSHALHLFALVLPDLRGTDSLVELLRDGDPVAADGMALKHFGNRLQELAGGRLIHPVNLQLGGVSCAPDREALPEIIASCRHWQEKVATWQGTFKQIPEQPPAQPACGTPLAVASHDPLPLWGDTLQGGTETSDVKRYRDWLLEQSQAESSAKRVTGPAGYWRTGALARCQLQPLSAAFDTANIHANNIAQLHEISLALETVGNHCQQLLAFETSMLLQVTPQLQSGSGAIALEAPRGTLVHQYGVDDSGRIAQADIITPTTINQVAIEEQLYADLAEGVPHEQLKPRAEQIVRAFDPCISCAVHMIRR